MVNKQSNAAGVRKTVLSETATTFLGYQTCWQWGLVDAGVKHDAHCGRQPRLCSRGKPAWRLSALLKRSAKPARMKFGTNLLGRLHRRFKLC